MIDSFAGKKLIGHAATVEIPREMMARVKKIFW